MANWAQLNESNIVINVTVGNNNDPAGDEGYSWLIENIGGTWVKTSYNAIGGKYRNPETDEITDMPGFRKNYAGIGYLYDSIRDAFIPPKPEQYRINEDNEEVLVEFVLNEETCLWDPVEI